MRILNRKHLNLQYCSLVLHIITMFLLLFGFIGKSRSLRVGSIRKYKFSVEFRFDVVRYIFGSDREHFSEEDFPAHLFPAGWSVVYDRLGDGCSISILSFNLLTLSSTSSFDGLGLSKDLQENEHESHYCLCIIHSYSVTIALFL